MEDRIARDDTFVRLVRKLADTSSSRLIENASIDHALIIIECLLDAAKKRREDVRIVSGCLLESFYSRLVEKATEVLQAKVPIRVVVLGRSREDLQNNAFYNAVNKHENGEVHVLAEDPGTTPHFVVTGDRRYRVEVDDEKKKAMASFNDSTTGKMLISIYESLLVPAAAAG